jgi:hypothetical protein
MGFHPLLFLSHHLFPFLAHSPVKPLLFLLAASPIALLRIPDDVNNDSGAM